MRESDVEAAQAVIMNVEAEQQLLGALLVSSDRLDSLGTAAGADLFADPVHRRIFGEIKRRHNAGELVSPVAMQLWADNDEGMKDLGGPRYLVRLAGASIGGGEVQSYARFLDGLRAKRELQDAIATAQKKLMDPESVAGDVAGALEAALMAAPSVAGAAPVSMMKAVTEALGQSFAAYSGEETNCQPTHILALDRMLGGFYPGELILLGGRPSMGKTAVALSMILNIARTGRGVAIASLEMTPEALAYRALSESTSQMRNAVPYANMRRGNVSEPQMATMKDAARAVADMPIQILPQSFRDLGSLYAGAKRAKALLGGAGLRLLVVDYLQLLRAPGKSRFEQITEISIALKALAAQLDCPILALSQLSRQVESREDKRPQLSDLRESGQLEQDADTILFCYRDEYYLEREKPEGGDALDVWQDAMERSRNRLEIIVAKQRMGEIGTARVRFNPALNLVWEG